MINLLFSNLFSKKVNSNSGIVICCFIIFFTFIIIVSCAGPPQQHHGSTESSNFLFDIPAGIQPNVKFWRRVYAHWGNQQVILHDDRYMDIIYSVIKLPLRIDGQPYEDPKKFIKWHLDAMKEILRNIEYKVNANTTLTVVEKRVLDCIQMSYGGKAAIFGASEHIRSQRGMREQFKHGLEMSKRYDAIFRKVFHDAGLPEDLVYLPHVESSFQNRATSSAGAVGMWQFMPDTARQFGMINDLVIDERLDPVLSAQGAARYLRSAYLSLDSWPMAITAYNHGIGGMKQARSLFGKDFTAIIYHYNGPGFGFASRNFYAEFLAARDIANNPTYYFPEGINYEKPVILDRIRLKKAAYLEKIAMFYYLSIQELININPAWKNTVQGVQLPAGTMIWLPAGTIKHISTLESRENELAADIISTNN